MRGHIVWIDILKGIAILLVVIGHNTSEYEFIYCFHMPLFFLISGFIFSPKESRIYLIRSSKRLLLPYITFLMCISLPEFVRLYLQNDIGSTMHMIVKMIYGGAYLKGIYAVFWFITVLWFSSNLFNYIIQKDLKVWLIPVLVLIGYIMTFIPLSMPWNINVVPMAIVYLWVGYLLKERSEVFTKYGKTHRISILVGSVLFLCIVYIFRRELMIDMKYNNMGIPIVSLATSVSTCLCVTVLAIEVSRVPLVAKILTFLGGCSMVIMYIHMPVKYYLTTRIFSLEANFIHIICSIMVSVIAYLLLKKNKNTRYYFLGCDK